jgi:hypothetical protein
MMAIVQMKPTRKIKKLLRVRELKFEQKIVFFVKRLCQSRKHQRPITLRRIVKNLAGRDTQKVIAL